MKPLISRTVGRFGLVLVITAWLTGHVTAGVEEAKPAAPASKQPASAEQIAKLVRQLGDKDYYVRQRRRMNWPDWGSMPSKHSKPPPPTTMRKSPPGRDTCCG